MIDRNGRVTEFSYDHQHRLTSEVWRSGVGGTVLRTIASTFDAADQLTSLSDPDSAYGYTKHKGVRNRCFRPLQRKKGTQPILFGTGVVVAPISRLYDGLTPNR